MELQIPIHTVFQMPSLLQAVAADTILAAAQSMALVFLSQNPLFSFHIIYPFNLTFCTVCVTMLTVKYAFSEIGLSCLTDLHAWNTVLS